VRRGSIYPPQPANQEIHFLQSMLSWWLRMEWVGNEISDFTREYEKVHLSLLAFSINMMVRHLNAQQGNFCCV